MELIAELATNHGGDLDLARRLIDAAVTAGADTIKTQAYQASSVNPDDPQAAWLVQSALSVDAHDLLRDHAQAQGARYFASVFDRASALAIARRCGRIKVASTVEVDAVRYLPDTEIVKSYRWHVPDRPDPRVTTALVTVPLYPTPPEVLPMVEWNTGWSDHTVGLSACLYAVAQGATTVEVHVSLPDAVGRQCAWDKSPDDLRRLKDWMQECQVMTTGVSQRFRDRWRS